MRMTATSCALRLLASTKMCRTCWTWTRKVRVERLCSERWVVCCPLRPQGTHRLRRTRQIPKVTHVYSSCPRYLRLAKRDSSGLMSPLFTWSCWPVDPVEHEELACFLSFSFFLTLYRVMCSYVKGYSRCAKESDRILLCQGRWCTSSHWGSSFLKKTTDNNILWFLCSLISQLSGCSFCLFVCLFS